MSAGRLGFALTLLGHTLAASVCSAEEVAAQAPAPTGKAVYLEKCAACHGDNGQGAEAYERSLAGDWPPGQLAEYITGSMPDGDPEDCVGDEAALVADYIYNAFYSPIAQARIRPPRRELSRLTVRQHQQTVADLIQTFRRPTGGTPEQGLAASYYRGLDARDDRRLAERIEPGVDFELVASGLAPPELLSPPPLEELKQAEQELADLQAKKPHNEETRQRLRKLRERRIELRKKQRRQGQVLCRWTGSLRADKTGEHELIVEGAVSLALDFNGQRRLIDARVRSDNEPVRRARVWLIEGRVYPIELRVFRETEADFHARLLWRPPGGVKQVIPARRLSPAWSPPVTVVGVRFPPDDRSVGYVRGASVSPSWTNAATRAALEVAKHVVDDLPRLAKVSEDLESDRPALQAFCYKLAERAFRRPLTPAESARVVDRWFDDGRDAQDAVLMSTLGALCSPAFLFPEVGTAAAGADHANASRLALALWDSLPDEALLRAAGRGELHTRQQIAAHAGRMLDDPRTRSKLSEFFRGWLHLDHDGELARDRGAFPDFDPGVAHDMRTSLELFLDRVVWSGDSDFRRLFLSDELFVNDNLAGFLGIEDRVGEGFWVSSADASDRSGVVTHPFLVASLAYSRETSPIHRGVFLARNILGRSLRPPPEAVAPLPPDVEPNLTTRQRVAMQTSPSACQGCHVMINHLGFTLERFDAVGRLRSDEAGKPVDASGFYVALDGRKTEFRGARDLAEFLADSPDVRRAFIVQLVEHVSKQPAPALGPGTVERLLGRFEEDNRSVRGALVEAAVAATLVD